MRDQFERIDPAELRAVHGGEEKSPQNLLDDAIRNRIHETRPDMMIIRVGTVRLQGTRATVPVSYRRNPNVAYYSGDCTAVVDAGGVHDLKCDNFL